MSAEVSGQGVPHPMEGGMEAGDALAQAAAEQETAAAAMAGHDTDRCAHACVPGSAVLCMARLLAAHAAISGLACLLAGCCTLHARKRDLQGMVGSS